MDDLISRQAVLDDLDRLWDMASIDGITASTVLAQIKTDVRNLPAMQKTGHWIQQNKGVMVTTYKCSVCGRCLFDDTGYDVYKDYPYCNCGVKMEETK